jgi:hypothetical protein
MTHTSKNNTPTQMDIFGALETASTPVVLSFGMGTDSTAILLRWLEEPSSRDFDLADLTVITAMVGDEYESTRELLEAHILPRLRQHNVRFVQVARANAKGELVVLEDSTQTTELHFRGAYKLSQEMPAGGTIPASGGCRQCSLKAKGEVLDRWMLSEYGDTEFRHVIGFESEETRRAVRDAKITRCQLMATKAKRTPNRLPEYPLIDWDWNRTACEDYIESLTGSRWLKSACTYCPFSTGKVEVLDRWTAEPEAATQALILEHRALALNPRMKLWKTKSAVERVREMGMLGTLRRFQAALDASEWSVYRVTRVFYQNKSGGFGAVRRLQVLATGDKDAMELELAKHGQVELEADHPTVWRSRKVEKAACVEDSFVVGLAGAVAKENRAFETYLRKYHELTADLAA